MVIIEDAAKKDILKNKKNKGKYIDEALKLLEDFLEACESRGINARRLVFPESQYTLKEYNGYYKSMQYLIKVKNFPITLVRKGIQRTIGLIIKDDSD